MSQVLIRFIVKQDVKTTYSNIARVAHSFNEFTIDFGEVSVDQNELATIHTRIVTSPQQFKEFVTTLQNTLEAYETSFGKIPTPPKPPQVKP